MNLVQRVQDILLKPKPTWPVIEQEQADVASLYQTYLIFLAAIPPVAGFIGLSVIGFGGFGMHIRMPFLSGLVNMVVSYGLSLLMVFVLALIVDALARAPWFQALAETVAVDPGLAGRDLLDLPHLHRHSGADEMPAREGRRLHGRGNRVRHRRRPHRGRRVGCGHSRARLRRHGRHAP